LEDSGFAMCPWIEERSDVVTVGQHIVDAVSSREHRRAAETCVDE